MNEIEKILQHEACATMSEKARDMIRHFANACGDTYAADAVWLWSDGRGDGIKAVAHVLNKAQEKS